MIIGIDASRANLDHKTGVEWYSYYLIRWLSKADSKNTYILYTDKPLTSGLLDLRNDQYIDGDIKNFSEIEYDSKGFQVLKSPFGNFKAKVLRWPFKYVWTQGRLSLEMLFLKPDILFMPANVLPIFHPRKSVSTIHDIGFETRDLLYDKEEIYSTTLRRIIAFFVKIITLNKYSANRVGYMRWATLFTYKNSKKIITVSNFSKSEIVKFYKKNPEKVKVVYNGYNKSLYRIIDNKNVVEDVKDKYGIENEYIFHVGRIEKKKNIITLVDAFSDYCKKNPESSIVLVLAGTVGYGYDEIIYLIAQHDIIDRVIIPGWIPEHDLPPLYNGANMFIFPSMYEGFGIPLLQAMACGVPVLASNIPTTKEVVGDAALLVDPESMSAITEGIEYLSTNDIARKEFVKKGLEVVENFSWEKCAKETLEELITV